MKECSLGIIWNADKSEVLLIKRRDVAVWVLPGGGIDPDESPETTVVREVLEETGLRVAIQYKAAEYAPINSWTRRTYLYVCHPLSGCCTTGDETLALQFFPLNALPARLFDYHREWLQEIIHKQEHKQKEDPYGHVPIQKAMNVRTFWKIIFKALLHPHLAIRYLCARFGFPINS